MCRSYNQQHGTRYLAAMPNNMYGPGDNYDLESSHVLPALIRKMHEAKAAGVDRVTIWGTGSPRREFLYSDDMADACVMMMNLPDDAFGEILRGPNGLPLSISDAARTRPFRTWPARGKRCRLPAARSNSTRASRRTPRKLLDVSRLRKLGWAPRIDLKSGIAAAYEDFLHREGAFRK